MIWTCKSKTLGGVQKIFTENVSLQLLLLPRHPGLINSGWVPNEENYPISPGRDYYNGFIQSRDCHTAKICKISFGRTLSNNLANEHCDFWMLEYPGDNDKIDFLPEELKQKLNWSSCVLWNEKKKKNQLNIFNIIFQQFKWRYSMTLCGYRIYSLWIQV